MKNDVFLKLGMALALAAALALAGCAPAAQNGASGAQGDMAVTIENPYAPQAGDSALERGIVYLDSVQWDAQAGALTFSGNLPTPCQELRIDAGQSGRQLTFEVYSVSQADMLCAQMLEPFEAVLKLENFSADAFTVLVNGEAAEL